MRVLKITGKDSEDFLHRVTSGTVKGLGIAEGSAGALLNGQSKMIAQFDLLRTESGYLLVSPAACFDALVQGLEKLHFAEELSMQEAGFANLREGSHEARAKKFHFNEEKSWPSPVPGYECFLSEREEADPSSWNFDRIGALATSPEDWDANTPALEAGVLPAIDRFKGCYPGQEVVERSLNVGHPARVLVAFEGEGELERGKKVALDGGGEGLVTSVAKRGSVTRAMVRLPWAKREAILPGFRALKADLK